ncbi:molybdenum cofactor guanylyltransferase [Pseudogracilibacillus sp. SO30301A]|uniref:molybdenum cofactor guanylyltransferase n=1 Tax=Pseudogracilibacillus sp. SO30301A TaxID=3098291 RepID=UPI00300E3E37
MSKKRVGILLAGGLSRRYGSPKAFAEMNGKKFHELVYETLHSVCDEVIVVTRKEFIDWFPKEYHVIVDIEKYAGFGPLAGIYSAMEELEADQYVVLPCDMPLVTSSIMKQLINFHTEEVTLAKSEGHLQPLVSVWNKNVKNKIRESLEKREFKMMDVLEKTDITQIEGSLLACSPNFFINVNTPEEDKEMRKWKPL